MLTNPTLDQIKLFQIIDFWLRFRYLKRVLILNVIGYEERFWSFIKKKKKFYNQLKKILTSAIDMIDERKSQPEYNYSLTISPVNSTILNRNIVNNLKNNNRMLLGRCCRLIQTVNNSHVYKCHWWNFYYILLLL